MAAKGNMPQASFHLAGPEDSVLYFSGPPRAVTGIIPVVNTGSEEQRIRGSIKIDSDKLRRAGGLRFGEIPFRTRLRAGQQADLRAKLPIDPVTPPGNYDFQITLGQRTLHAVAYIPEVVDLYVFPRKITIIASPKTSSYTRPVVFENRGNVPLLTGNQCEVPIIDNDSLANAVLEGLNKGDPASTDSMVKAALVELAHLKVGTLIIKRKAMTLSPGQKGVADLQFELPGNLKPQHHYSTFVSLYNASLRLEIYTTSKSEPVSRKRK
jgi:hypothetical protein